MSGKTPAAQRGHTQVSIPLHWRLDGAGARPESPLVVALHGQGMDEDQFALLLQKLLRLPYRFLLPRAPWPVEMRAEQRIGWSWYAYDGDQERFRSALARTEEMLLQVLRDAEAAHGLRPRRRVLLGFSQGGYCGAVIALRHLELFHGMVVS
jgi:predicted esterase